MCRAGEQPVTERAASGSTLLFFSFRSISFLKVSLKYAKGVLHIWLASTDHRTSPRQLASTENEDSVWFLPNGELIYRASEKGNKYVTSSNKTDLIGRGCWRYQSWNYMQCRPTDGGCWSDVGLPKLPPDGLGRPED